MKGLTHFIMGMAIATCFSVAVKANLTEGSLILLLGGGFGILADTLDFRVAKYLEHHDYDVDPDPEQIDPTAIARTMAEAIDEAWDKQKTVQMLFHTMKMSADLWRQYTLSIDTTNKKIVCKIGPLVTTGKSPLPGTEPPEDRRYGEWPFKANVLHTYDKENYVDIFSGPDFAFVPDGEFVRVDFIPFHRRWTHSITFPMLLAPLGFLLFGFTQMGLVASCIILFGYWGHVMLDQTGMMGSNLFPPFTKKRSSGMNLTRSGGAVGNFYTNVTMIMLILWNLNYFSPLPVVGSSWADALGVTSYWGYYLVGLANWLVYFAFIPLGLLYILLHFWVKYHPEAADEPEKLTKEEGKAVEMIKAYEDVQT